MTRPNSVRDSSQWDQALAEAVLILANSALSRAVYSILADVDRSEWVERLAEAWLLALDDSDRELIRVVFQIPPARPPLADVNVFAAAISIPPRLLFHRAVEIINLQCNEYLRHSDEWAGMEWPVRSLLRQNGIFSFTELTSDAIVELIEIGSWGLYYTRCFNAWLAAQPAEGRTERRLADFVDTVTYDHLSHIREALEDE